MMSRVLHATPTLTPAKYLSTPVDKYFVTVKLFGHGRLRCAERLLVLIPWQFFLANTQQIRLVNRSKKT